MAAIPFFKLGVLLVKQATKPMARAIKSRAAASERISQLCEFFGQSWHIQTTKLNLRVQGHKVKEVKRLNDQEAIQSGAELLAEGFVLSVGISALILESLRSAKANAEKAAQKAERREKKVVAMQHLNDTVRDLIHYSNQLSRTIEQMEKNRIELEKHKKDSSYTPPPPIAQPVLPKSLKDMISGQDSPTDLVTAAHISQHGEIVTDPEAWKHNAQKEAAERVGYESVTTLIKWFGSIINGETVDVDLGEDEE